MSENLEISESDEVAGRAVTGKPLWSELGNLVRAEWIRLRTQRAVWWSFFGFMAPTTVLIAVVAMQQGPAATDGVALITLSLLLLQLGFAVVGAVFVGTEFGHGTMHGTLLAAPRRHRVVAAKCVTMAIFGFGLGVFSAVFIVLVDAAARGQAPAVDLKVMRTILGMGAYLSVLGAFTVSVAILLRNTIGAVLTMIAVVYVIPVAAAPLLGIPNLTDLWPTIAGLAFVVPEVNATLSPVLSFSVFLFETLIIAMAASAYFNRRDV
ncbi:ABC transporter permease [Lentzea sp. NPDC051838]|uniref:ABC transporter permease n=1 Tax=Lentzea sp. NPDC051838 TaxID=3154849 RepID=UPI003430B438